MTSFKRLQPLHLHCAMEGHNVTNVSADSFCTGDDRHDGNVNYNIIFVEQKYIFKTNSQR